MNGAFSTRQLLAVGLIIGGAWSLWQGGYIHAKALLAQHLLEDAWSRSATTGQGVTPWPWADTWPVARLSVPRLGIRRLVLAGGNGASLAFGPGLLFQSAPVNTGNSVIVGHRDTHFAFLGRLRRGDVIIAEDSTNTPVRYRVTSTRVTTADDIEPLLATSRRRLTLVTCFPFDAIHPGTDQRFLVVAEPETETLAELAETGGEHVSTSF